MAQGYARIGEPLNLCTEGRRWLSEVCLAECDSAHSEHALVLGATPWLGRFLGERHQRVTLVDRSEAMLRMARAELVSNAASAQIDFVEAAWLELPALVGAADTVVGDNSMSFLPFPSAWTQLCDLLAQRMTRNGRLVTRICSPPTRHCSEPVAQIVAEFLARESINFTELRARLLFADWSPDTYEIDTEQVLRSFENNQTLFEPLLRRFPLTPDNDLLTIEKYRGAGARYTAPPLGEALEVFRTRFKVMSVHFGPYAMSDYFPLVVAVRK